MVRVGVVGCGTIGSQLALAIQRSYSSVARITVLHDTNRTHAVTLQRRLASHPRIVSLSTLLQRSDLVLEAASADLAATLVPQALRQHRNLLVMSVGGLLRSTAWQRLARRSHGKVYIPSGALAGLDGVKAMAIGRITKLSLTTSKPPRALAGAPYVQRQKLRLDRLRRPSVIFEGSPRAVVRAFPQNTNVAAALALASGQWGARARIRVVADPSLRRNQHEVDVEGDCGRIRCTIQSVPSENPKTSELAVRSAVATLEPIFGVVAIGT